ncbi:hypothetical protein AGMMS49525_12810 [Bacteroidia bacterium]|nr:hypothetical protein AGMMS49525_12810 [Bacteroidia bacterium]
MHKLFDAKLHFIFEYILSLANKFYTIFYAEYCFPQINILLLQSKKHNEQKIAYDQLIADD